MRLSPSFMPQGKTEAFSSPKVLLLISKAELYRIQVALISSQLSVTGIMSLPSTECGAIALVPSPSK